jgi:hypothetical protein
MNRYYWTRICPICSEGRLLIFKDLTRGTLYLHCEECEWGWRDAALADQRNAGFLTLNEEFESEPADIEEIRARGWERYVAGSFEDTSGA